MTAETSSSLLIRICDAQDHESWSTFVRVYTPIVFRFVTKRGLQEADAADVTQDVLIEVARGIRRFEYRPEAGRFRDWLLLIVRRRLIKFWERTKVNATLLDEPARQGTDPEWTETFQSELLRVAMDKLRSSVEPRSWAAFERTWKDGVSAGEVSRQLNMPIDLVYSAKSRIQKRLENEIRALGDDCGWIG